MSYTAVGRNKVYASIEDLPENQKLVDGDRILIQTEDGTALVDYLNVKVDLNHTTFGTQVTQLIEFTSTVEQYIEEMDASFNEIREETTTMKNQVQELKEQMDCCKLLFKHIMGSVSPSATNFIEEQVNTSLSTHGLAMYNECVDAVKSVQQDFSFNRYNILT